MSEKQEGAKRAYTVNDFCAAWSLSRATFYRLVAAGKLKSIHVGRRVLIPAEAIEAWAADVRKAAA
jgi:excisionase family DNA binding protein